MRSAANGYGVVTKTKQKFTSKQRDDETGLDFFEARHYSSTQGRFTTPDEFAGGPTELFVAVAAHNPTFYAELAEPQSLNKYTYCLNNPYKFVDPDGHQAVVADFLNQAGQEALRAGPYGQAVARGLFAAGAAATIIANTDWGKVKKDIKEGIASGGACQSFEDCSNIQQMMMMEAQNQKAKEAGTNQEGGQNANQSQPANSGKKPADSSKNEKHGDDGRAKAKAEKSAADLKAQITPGMPRKERIKIENKIKRINLNADRADKGTEDGRRGR